MNFQLLLWISSIVAYTETSYSTTRLVAKYVVVQLGVPGSSSWLVPKFVVQKIVVILTDVPLFRVENYKCTPFSGTSVKITKLYYPIGHLSRDHIENWWWKTLNQIWYESYLWFTLSHITNNSNSKNYSCYTTNTTYRTVWWPNAVRIHLLNPSHNLEARHSLIYFLSPENKKCNLFWKIVA